MVSSLVCNVSNWDQDKSKTFYGMKIGQRVSSKSCTFWYSIRLAVILPLYQNAPPDFGGAFWLRSFCPSKSGESKCPSSLAHAQLGSDDHNSHTCWHCVRNSYLCLQWIMYHMLWYLTRGLLISHMSSDGVSWRCGYQKSVFRILSKIPFLEAGKSNCYNCVLPYKTKWGVSLLRG